MARIHKDFPSKLKPLLRPFYHYGFRSQLRMRCFLHDFFNQKYNRRHNIPPAIMRFRVSESIDLSDFLRIGEGCANLIHDSLSDIDAAFKRGSKVLDFGCGCGRVLRWLMMQEPLAEFYGSDVDVDAIRWCKQNLNGGHFECNAPNPPLPYPGEYFDIIYCFSVFTHLDEELQNAWLEELKRVLKRNGTLIFTVHGPIAAAELNCFEREKLCSSGFLCYHSTKLKGIVPTWYHTTWHTEQYVLEHASKWFRYIEYRTVPNSGQDMVRCRKYI